MTSTAWNDDDVELEASLVDLEVPYEPRDLEEAPHVIAEFFGSRRGFPADAFVPTMLAAATQGLVQAAHTRWFLRGGDLSGIVSEGLEILGQGIGTDPTTWSASMGKKDAKRRRD